MANKRLVWLAALTAASAVMTTSLVGPTGAFGATADRATRANAVSKATVPLVPGAMYEIKSNYANQALSISPSLADAHEVYQYTNITPLVFWRYWKFLPQGGDVYRIQNLNNRQCVWADSGVGAHLVATYCDSQRSLWKISYGATGTYAFESTLYPGFCATLNQSTTLSAPLLLKSCASAKGDFTLFQAANSAFAGGIPTADGGKGGLLLAGSNGTSGDTYQLRTSSPNCLEGSSGQTQSFPVKAWRCSLANEQQFRIWVPYPATDPDVVKIQSGSSLQCLEPATSGYADVVQRSCADTVDQWWTVWTNPSTGAVDFRNWVNDKCLAMPGGAGTTARLQDCANSPTRFFTPVPGGYA